MARRGRPKKTNAQRLKDALERNQPADYIIERRKLFSFVQLPADKRQDGRNGEIDSEVCDPLGQLCAVGLFDGHGHDPREMVRLGRFWGGHLVHRNKPSGPKVAAYEHRSRSTAGNASDSPADLLFERIDATLGRYERAVLFDLIVAPLLGHHENCIWADPLIAEGLRARGRFMKCASFPTLDDKARLQAAIRGLLALVDGALPARFAA